MKPDARTKKLTTIRLAAATYFLVAGGPYGLEELVQAGGFAYAALAVATIPLIFSLPTALMVGELAGAIPEDGGYYAWVKRALGPFWGFVEGWLSLCASFFDMALYPTLFVTYLARLVPGLEGTPARIVVGAAMIAVCVASNLRGARGVGGSSVVLSVVLLGPFVAFTIACALRASDTTTPLPRAEGGSFGAGLLVAMWNFMGWDNASTFADDVDRPERTYPRAMALAVVAVTITYLIPIAMARHAGLAAADWEIGSWTTAAGNVGGPWLARAVVLGGIVSGFGMFNALLLSYSRVPAAMAADGILPRAFAKTNALGVPWVSVAVCACAYGAALLLDFRRLVEIDLLFYGASLSLEFVALVVLRLKEPTLARPVRIPGGLAGAVVAGILPTSLFVFALASELRDGTHAAALFAVSGSLVVGGLVWLTRRRRRRNDGDRAPLWPLLLQRWRMSPA